jgi:hypothetical protein
MRELLKKEWRVISSRGRSPLPLRLLKWAVFLGISWRLYGTKWFPAWILGLPTAGVATHLLYRYKTQGWTRPWGGWKDVEVIDPADGSWQQDKRSSPETKDDRTDNVLSEESGSSDLVAES